MKKLSICSRIILATKVLFIGAVELSANSEHQNAATSEASPSASHNTDSPKFPTLDECYKTIPFPADEHECAMFVAGIAECHKFIVRQLRRLQ